MVHFSPGCTLIMWPLSTGSKWISDYFGVISKPCDKSNLDQPGVISTDRININYYERDRQNSFTLLGTGYYFRFRLPVFTSGFDFRRKLKIRWQKTIRLFITKQLIKDHERNVRSTSDSEPTKLPKKERKVLGSNLTKTMFLFHILGIVAAVKGSYGFIKRDKSRIDRKNQESRIFFHSSEILDANSKLGRRRIKMGNEVSPDSPSWTGRRIPTVKLKIPGKAFLKSESRTSVTFKL